MNESDTAKNQASGISDARGLILGSIKIGAPGAGMEELDECQKAC